MHNSVSYDMIVRYGSKLVLYVDAPESTPHSQLQHAQGKIDIANYYL